MPRASVVAEQQECAPVAAVGATQMVVSKREPKPAASTSGDANAVPIIVLSDSDDVQTMKEAPTAVQTEAAPIVTGKASPSDGEPEPEAEKFTLPCVTCNVSECGSTSFFWILGSAPWFDVHALVVDGFIDRYAEDCWLPGNIALELTRTWS